MRPPAGGLVGLPQSMQETGTQAYICDPSNVLLIAGLIDRERSRGIEFAAYPCPLRG